MKTIFYLQNKIHVSEYPLPGYAVFYKDPDIHQIQLVVKRFLQKEPFECLLTGNTKKIIRMVRSHFTPVKAAGGVVVNPSRQILLIKRMGVWDLPKGKIETGEGKLEGALREVTEECGIQPLIALRKLSPSYHVYQQQNLWMFKTTFWYLMAFEGTYAPVPQLEEQIESAVWINPGQLMAAFDTYPSIRKVLHQSLFLLE